MQLKNPAAPRDFEFKYGKCETSFFRPGLNEKSVYEKGGRCFVKRPPCISRNNVVLFSDQSGLYSIIAVAHYFDVCRGLI